MSRLLPGLAAHLLAYPLTLTLPANPNPDPNPNPNPNPNPYPSPGGSPQEGSWCDNPQFFVGLAEPPTSKAAKRYPPTARPEEAATLYAILSQCDRRVYP